MEKAQEHGDKAGDHPLAGAGRGQQQNTDRPCSTNATMQQRSPVR
jgi:hypothetical protein